jgi:peptide/nickel transport system substrate-binding protein
MNPRSGLWLVVVALALALTACGGAGGQAADEPASAGMSQAAAAPAPERVAVLRILAGDFSVPTPFLHRRAVGMIRMYLMFDTLIWKDSTGEFIPWLATSWDSSPDGLTWTFKVREGVRWQDGEPLTADDVVFTYRYMAQPGLKYAPDVKAIEKVEQVDDHTVVMTLARPTPPFLRNVIGVVPIIPRHIWEGVADPKGFTEEAAFIGSGAYRLIEYDKAQGTFLFEANDDFWLGAPYVKRIEMVEVGDQAVALKQGAVHGVDLGSKGTRATDDVLALFLEDSRFAEMTAPGDWSLALYFNMERDPFADKSFRQAVAYAFDLQMMVDQLLLGDGLPGSPGHLPPSNTWMDPDAPAHVYDPARAKALLDEGGYLDRDGDGVRETLGGVPLEFELTFSEDYPREAEMIRGWLEAMGIGLKLRVLDRTTLDQVTTEGQYELALIGAGGGGADPDSLRESLASDSEYESFSSVFGYKNERFDELAAQQSVTLDEAARREMVYEMQLILAEDVPTIPLYYPNRRFVFDETVLDAWYFTPGGFASGCPNSYNKHIFIVGEKTGLKIRGQ